MFMEYRVLFYVRFIADNVWDQRMYSIERRTAVHSSRSTANISWLLAMIRT